MSQNDIIISPKYSKKYFIFSKLITWSIGYTSRLWSKYLNKTEVHNIEEFINLITNRPPGKPLITICNHDSCCDDPLVFGATVPTSFFYHNQNKFRWSLGAREVCFSKPWHSYFFRAGKVLPIVRGDGVYQPIMNQILEELNKGEWLHIFPEGKVNEEKKFLRLKWGVGRLISDCKVTPIVLPFYHRGFDDILPNVAPYRPRLKQKTTIVFGKPIYLDDFVSSLKEKRLSAVEIRKQITDRLQEEYYKLKEITDPLHEKHLKKN